MYPPVGGTRGCLPTLGRPAPFPTRGATMDLPRTERRDPPPVPGWSHIMGLILLIVLVVLLLGTLPRWPHSRNWGYGPSGGLGLILVIILILVLLGKL